MHKNYSVYERALSTRNLNPKSEWTSIKTIDMHTCGEPLRVILEGFPELKGDRVLDFRKDARQNYDHFRRALMFEPRGHADMYGCLLTPPNDESGDFGILFLHNEGYSTMCGHAIIGITTLALEMGWVEPEEPETVLKIDAPCGRITAFARMDGKRVAGVSFHCVPSFVVDMDAHVNIPGMGQLKYDLAYGGAFYAYVDARQLNLELTPENYPLIIQAGKRIKKAVIETNDRIKHPFEEDLSFLYGTIFIGDPVSEGVDSRNVCVFADGEVDRCPTGSGVSGRMPIHFQRGEIRLGEPIKIESILGTVFSGSVVEETRYGPFQAVIPKVEGTAHITGKHEFIIDPDDPLKYGFLLR